jgi:alpha-N-arabinofuranosidase
MRYLNPVLPGFHPDPSVCRVGGDYYLATSSFEYFPGVPLFHSLDLVHWRQIGYCLTRESQLNLHGVPCSAGIWAPTVRYNAGTFYMITTNMNAGGNFYVTASDPSGPWSEPVWIDRAGFDPSLFFDDDGTVYYSRRNGGRILQAEIDLSNGSLEAAPREIITGMSSPDIEGPHMYKIDGTYYLMCAEGGTRFGHSETIARSHSPWGPFEKCPHNPIVTHRHLSGNEIRDTGHAELLEAHDGSWWLFCLGTRHHRYDSATILGRETFLAPVAWDDDGWPVVGDRGIIRPQFDAPALSEHPWPEDPVRDDFDTEELRPCWNYIRNPTPGSCALRSRPGFLRLAGSAASLDDQASPTFVGRRQEHFTVTVTARLEFTPAAENEEAGLTVLMSKDFHYDCAVTMRQGRWRVVLRKRVGDIRIETAGVALRSTATVLQIVADPRKYVFRAGDDNGQMTEVGTGLTELVGSELAATWTGMYIGMYSSGNGSTCCGPADFDWFEYSPGGV